MSISKERLEEKLWEKVDKHPGFFHNGTECWYWIGARYSNNYGHLRRNKKDLLAHKFIYEMLIQPIEDTMTIDHLCKNKPCVNPLHLEQVTMRINLLRSNSISGINARKTHCPKGHAYDENSICYKYSKYGQRYCKQCSKLRNKCGKKINSIL